LVDQLNCGEVYYITWTRQPLITAFSGSNYTSNAASAPLSPLQHQQPWTRVYLYTGANDSSPHKPIGELINRAHFLMPERPTTSATDDGSTDTEQQPPTARLVIEEPKLSDEALYKCDVTYVRGKCPSISLVRVRMMALPSKAQIVDVQSTMEAHASGAYAEGQLIGPYNEHESLRLACLVQGGRPQPKSVSWRKIDASGRTINLIPAKLSQQAFAAALLPGSSSSKQQSEFAPTNLVRVDLNHTLTSADLGAKFECHVEHEAIEQPSARVVVSGNEQANVRQADATLDLHPSRQPVDEEQDDAASALALRSRSLDSHVLVDLNGR